MPASFRSLTDCIKTLAPMKFFTALCWPEACVTLLLCINCWRVPLYYNYIASYKKCHPDYKLFVPETLKSTMVSGTFFSFLHILNYKAGT